MSYSPLFSKAHILVAELFFSRQEHTCHLKAVTKAPSYADLITEDLRCHIRTCSLINENQLALEAANLELSNWVEQRDAAYVANKMRCTLEAIDRNEEFIEMTLAVMMAPE